MNEFMKRAVQLSADNVRDGGHPFGAVIVKNGQIVAEGVNEMHHTFDVSGHAELLAIRRLQKDLQTNDLSGYTMYASGEPCPMCYTAMRFAGLDDIYYCQSVEEAGEAGLGLSGEVYHDLKKPNEERQTVMKQMKLTDGMENPMQLYAEKSK
ncbi:nucleoside deaminase [Jeotgalibacillus sp. R-1-5s-1]|uniref:nucleoside deaminase n=1 Tax=Jeotgalibacillus sp. R-1-5s-1 TaxID=2555897 RepID=UPI00106BC8AA|nr:nucleoside deaminase [Jeotgalibacillus sp. R-1-5s-1]TFE00071.1 nucleoside deaminase [Jeotgalibacillus sp. R-1-5s-1]